MVCFADMERRIEGGREIAQRKWLTVGHHSHYTHSRSLNTIIDLFFQAFE